MLPSPNLGQEGGGAAPRTPRKAVKEKLKTKHPYNVNFNNRSTLSAPPSYDRSRLIPELEKTD